MKSLLLFLSVFTFLSVGSPVDNKVPSEPEATIKTVTAVFDAYEGEVYFFTNTTNNKALTLFVESDEVVEPFKLKDGENIGELFNVTIERKSKTDLIRDIEKLDAQ